MAKSVCRHFVLLLAAVVQLSGLSAQDTLFAELARHAVLLTNDPVKYDPAYFRISYPGGDVPSDKGVCTDVVIRAYRKLGIDLQKEVHEDMKKNFSSYPANWGLSGPDTNIDHRRVPNLMTFFSRKGIALGRSVDPHDFMPGDIVTWDLGKGLTHIGIVSAIRAPDSNRLLIVHNIGNGQELSDCLFSYRITGHYRYMPTFR